LEFAKTIDMEPQALDRLLAGDLLITVALARKLANSVGATVEFWLARDGQYRDDLSRIETNEWATGLPITQMVELGWIASPSDWKARLEPCLGFFDVDDLGEWRRRYEPILQGAHFRSSNVFREDPLAILAWLRQGEIAVSAATRQTSKWSAKD